MNQQYSIFPLNKRKIQRLCFQKPQKLNINATYIAVCPRANGASAVPGVSPGRGLLISLLGEFKVDDGDEIFSVRWSSLISILWWTIASSSFDWLTRLFCSFPNHDKTLTVILNLHFENKNAVIWAAENA